MFLPDISPGQVQVSLKLPLFAREGASNSKYIAYIFSTQIDRLNIQLSHPSTIVIFFFYFFKQQQQFPNLKRLRIREHSIDTVPWIQEELKSLPLAQQYTDTSHENTNSISKIVPKNAVTILCALLY